MKTINLKSLLLGVVAAFLIIIMLSARAPEPTSNFEFVATHSGVGIYNKDTKTLYMYVGVGMAGALSTKPPIMYKVADDGASITAIK